MNKNPTSPELKQKLILDIEEKLLLASTLSDIRKLNQSKSNVYGIA
jgi:hypothetical protein